MRLSNITSALTITLLTLTTLSAQFDDVFFDREAAKAEEQARLERLRQNAAARSANTVEEEPYNDYYGYEFDDESEYYSDYDYAYTTRIRRFHTPQPPLRNYNSFDYWYNDYYYDPFYSTGPVGVNVFIGTPVFGWNRYNRWYYGSSWNRWNRWNSFNRWNAWNSWDTWGFYDPWGWNSWGWNSYAYCPPMYGYWGNNVYYTNVYNHYYNNNNNGGWNNGNNNGGWGDNGVTTKFINSSRRDRGLVSSTGGRSTTRRNTDTNGTNPGVISNPTVRDDKLGTAEGGTEPRATTRRTYKGDIKNNQPTGTTRPGYDGENIGSSDRGTTRRPVTTPRDSDSMTPSNRQETDRIQRGESTRPSTPTRRDEPASRPAPSQRRSDDNNSTRSSSGRSGGGSESSSSRSSRSSDSYNRSDSGSGSGRSGGYDNSSSRSSSSRSYDSGNSRSSSSGGSYQSSGSSRSSSGSSSGSSSSGRSGSGSSRRGGGK